MDRFDKLLQELIRDYPNDQWIEHFLSLHESDIEQDIRMQISVYKSALHSLDESSWQALKAKVNKLFKQSDSIRGKQQFFNQLNEVLAYKYLKDHGYSNITFVPEGTKEGVKSPDLEFEEQGKKGLCEVKTINKSDEELNRCEVFDSSIYAELSDGFINKFKFHLDNAQEKMPNSNSKKLVYMVVHFDDLLLSFFSKYEKEILSIIEKEYADLEIFVQVGLVGNRNIHYVPKNA